MARLSNATNLRVRPVTGETWTDFTRLFQSRGSPHYCWCTLHRFHGSRKMSDVQKRQGMKDLVENANPDRRAGVRRQRTGWLVLDRAARNVRPARALENDAPGDSSCDPDLGRTLLLRDSAVPRPQRDRRAPPGGCRVCARERSRDRRGIPVRHSGSQFYTPGTLVGLQGGWLPAGRQAVVAPPGAALGFLQRRSVLTARCLARPSAARRSACPPPRRRARPPRACQPRRR